MMYYIHNNTIVYFSIDNNTNRNGEINDEAVTRVSELEFDGIEYPVTFDVIDALVVV